MGCFLLEGGSKEPFSRAEKPLSCAERGNNNIHNKSRTLMCLTPGALKGLSRQGLQTGF